MKTHIVFILVLIILVSFRGQAASINKENGEPQGKGDFESHLLEDDDVSIFKKIGIVIVTPFILLIDWIFG